MQVRCTEKTKQKSRIKTRSLVAIFQKKKSTQEKKIRRLDHLPSSGVRPVSSHVNKPILRGHPFKRISPLYHLSTRRFRVSIVFFFQPTSSTLILITEIKLHPIPTSQKKKKTVSHSNISTKSTQNQLLHLTAVNTDVNVEISNHER